MRNCGSTATEAQRASRSVWPSNVPISKYVLGFRKRWRRSRTAQYGSPVRSGANATPWRGVSFIQMSPPVCKPPLNHRLSPTIADGPRQEDDAGVTHTLLHLIAD